MPDARRQVVQHEPVRQQPVVFLGNLLPVRGPYGCCREHAQYLLVTPEMHRCSVWGVARAAAQVPHEGQGLTEFGRMEEVPGGVGIGLRKEAAPADARRARRRLQQLVEPLLQCRRRARWSPAGQVAKDARVQGALAHPAKFQALQEGHGTRVPVGHKCVPQLVLHPGLELQRGSAASAGVFAGAKHQHCSLDVTRRDHLRRREEGIL
mmetsp:Transcript_53268/g.170656  ORF Transcript_53268/g.170656 Transcript_53268/m.170656 type:complete len:208 (-) Transcript_53268:222-845(-)